MDDSLSYLFLLNHSAAVMKYGGLVNQLPPVNNCTFGIFINLINSVLKKKANNDNIKIKSS